MATLDLTTAVRLFGEFEGASDLTDAIEAIDIALSKRVLNGTGTDQANEFWSDQRTVTAAAESLNFVDGSLSNTHGDTITLSKVKGLLIVNTSTTATEDLTISGDLLTNFGTITSLTLTPGGYLLWTAPTDGHAVATPASDVLTINPGSDTIVYNIVVWGVT
jgi:hypothetical protein